MKISKYKYYTCSSLYVTMKAAIVAILFLLDFCELSQSAVTTGQSEAKEWSLWKQVLQYGTNCMLAACLSLTPWCLNTFPTIYSTSGPRQVAVDTLIDILLHAETWQGVQR